MRNRTYIGLVVLAVMIAPTVWAATALAWHPEPACGHTLLVGNPLKNLGTVELTLADGTSRTLENLVGSEYLYVHDEHGQPVVVRWLATATVGRPAEVDTVELVDCPSTTTTTVLADPVTTTTDVPVSIPPGETVSPPAAVETAPQVDIDEPLVVEPQSEPVAVLEMPHTL